MSFARRSRAVLLVAALLASVAAAAHAAPATALSAQAVNPVRLIVDSDLFSDADDVGAIATAFALQMVGEA
jgi:hypothetical protein